jgi:copper(I)-binding protein
MIRMHLLARLLFASAFFASIPVAAASDEDFPIHDPWISLPIYGEAPRVYFVIQNSTPKSRRLIAATSPRCRSIELRLASFEGGAEGSKRLTEIEIPAGGAAAFSPRGPGWATDGGRAGS